MAHQLRTHATIAEAPELTDHIPRVPPPEKTPDSWRPVFDGYNPAEAASGHAIANALTSRFAQATDDDTHEVLVAHSYPIAWLMRGALDTPPERWLELNSANAALTTIEYRPHQPPALTSFNDMSHLPERLRWTGFPARLRP